MSGVSRDPETGPPGTPCLPYAPQRGGSMHSDDPQGKFYPSVIMVGLELLVLLAIIRLLASW